ncbi:50S ribosomal protein L13 [Vulcanisaeta distributa]|uniref:Large ribosomal subunit protein uL13 n=1 Tax=Vulcanisaeta distributa (strain DSM 14429 / JCM 11212 / NBRC 100878 / IC-017) TaxID=572478 RepID=E1QSA5_VULDI|nr:50S ribosomal protein L13 [Vulcanisaeta distributa]ADN49498.1 ribosomal protein L13 [Vulcanisaeta distributa DSM 14429]
MSSRVIVVERNPPELNEVVVDATNHVVGRLASIVAKWALEGRRVVIVNAEKAVITGDFNMVLNWYKTRISEWLTHYNPEKAGPKIPRKPDRILRRVIRGMLPRKEPRGRQAYKRIRVFMGVPPQYMSVDKVVIKGALLSVRPGAKYVTLEELWSHIEPKQYEAWRKAKEAWETRMAKLKKAESKGGNA